MPIELCPHCRTSKNMRESLTRRKENSPDGTTKEIETRILHCTTCNTFVRSEDHELDPKQ